MKTLLSIFILFMLWLASLIPSRKKIETLHPMGCKPAIIPPSYKCKSATPIDPSKISEKIKSYSTGERAKDIHEFHSNLLTQLYGNKLTA